MKKKLLIYLGVFSFTIPIWALSSETLPDNHFSFLLILIIVTSAAIIFASKYYATKRKNADITKKQSSENHELKRQLAASKKIEKAAQNRSSKKDKLFSIIAHDLKNPLSVMLLTTDFLQMDLEGFPPNELKTHLNNIHTSAKRLSELLENLLDWSRSESQHIQYRPATHNVLKLTTAAVELMQANADYKKIEITMSVPVQLVSFCDSKMVTTVMRNLISNAIKFTDEEGKVIISAVCQGDFIRVDVTDTGRGMEHARLESLFSPAAISSSNGTADERGTGLGLVLCKEFVEKNDGHISVQSKLGCGTTFSFTLPSDFNINDYS